MLDMWFTRNNTCWLNLAALGVAWCVVQASHAQTVTERGLRPVDTAVEDRDPLQRSLRVIEPGLSTTGERTAVHQRIMPGGDDHLHQRHVRLYYLGQGFTAEYDRSQYAANRRGDLFATIPSNTVFHIAPPREPFATAGDEYLPGRVDGRIGPDDTGTAPTGDADRVRDTHWERYNTSVMLQRAVVVEVLNRPAGSS